MPKEIQPQLRVPPKNNPFSSLMSFVVGFIVLLGAIVAAAVAISNWGVGHCWRHDWRYHHQRTARNRCARSNAIAERRPPSGVSVSAFSNDINQRVKPLIRVNLGISKSCKSYFILRKPFFVAFKSYFVPHLGIHQDLVLFAELTAGAQTCRGE
jgi:hypothetical protein